ncbi:hypothetical protein Tco_1139150 [Tanacetum coccineum]
MGVPGHLLVPSLPPGNLISGQQSLNPAHIAVARQAQPVTSQQSQPTPQAFGPSGILGPHPSTVASVPNTTTPGRCVFEPYGDQPSYLPHAFNAMSLQIIGPTASFSDVIAQRIFIHSYHPPYLLQQLYFSPITLRGIGDLLIPDMTCYMF